MRSWHIDANSGHAHGPSPESLADRRVVDIPYKSRRSSLYAFRHMAKSKRHAPKTEHHGADRVKAEEKRARRVARQLEELKSKQQARRKRRVRNLGYGILGTVAVSSLLFVAVRPGAELTGVERPRNEGRNHVAAASYATATPTSGEHSASSVNCGVYSQTLPLDVAVHSLEHGAVIVWYTPDLADSERQSLEEMVNRWDSHVIVSPNPALTDPVVATAWNRLMRFENVGDDLAEFIDVYRERGPEKIRCDI